MSRIKVDRITDRAGTGEPLFPNGIKVVGITSLANVVAGVATFSNVSVGGTLTYEDVTNIDSVGLITARRGIIATGVVTATSFDGDGSQLSGIDTDKISEGNTEVEVVDTGSDGHVKMTTEGGERVRVGPAGQIGLGGANYGTSGQVITSAGNAGAPSWAALPAGGNIIEAESEGSIAADKCVQIRTDGKVEQIKEALGNKSAPSAVSSNENGTGNYFYTNDAGNSGNAAINANRGATWVYDPDNDRIVVLWKLGGGSQFYARVGTPNRVTGVTTWGSRVMIDNGQLNNPTAVYDTVRNKIVLMGFISTSLRAFVGTVASTGNSSTWTTDSVCPNTDSSEGANTSSAYDPTTGRTIITYTDTSNNPNGARMQIGHVNTSGAFVWHTGMTSSNNYLSLDMFSTGAGAIENMDVQSVGDSKWVFVLSIEGTNPSGFPDKGIFAKIINAPTTVTATPTYANAGAIEIKSASALSRGVFPIVAWDPNKEKLLFIYQAKTGNGDPGTNDRHYALLAYFNAGKTNITINNAVYLLTTAHPETTSMFQLVYDSGTQSFVYATKAAEGIVRGIFLTPSGTGNNTLTIPSTVGNCFNTNSSDFGERSSHTLIDIGTGGISNGASALFSIYTFTAVGYSRTLIIPTTAIATNLTDGNHYLGFADQAYTDGQTATIKTVGNTATTLSGLTAGTKYYVQTDGTVGTSAGSPAALAGLAIAPTKLLIREPKSDV